MQYTRFGGTGLVVSRLCLGTATFGKQTDEPVATEILDLCALTTSPGARAFYDQHRAAGDLHHQALRALGNRLVGILHGCLRHHTVYDEHRAWAHRQTSPTSKAA